MNTVFQVKNGFDHEVMLTSSIGLNIAIKPGETLDINFPSDAVRTVQVEIAPVPVPPPAAAAGNG